MARVQLRVNNENKTLIESVVTREGDRAIDQTTFTVPLGSTVCVSDCISITQDAVNLNGIVGAYMMQGDTLDESGRCNNAVGAVQTPRKDVNIIWCSTCSSPTSCGFRELTITENGTVTCVAGKVNIKGLCFDGTCDYLTIIPECIFDLDQTTPFSFSAWVKTSDVSVPLIAKKATGPTDKGWEVSLDACGRVDVRLVNTATTNELNVRGDSAVNDCTWNHIGVTYNGIPGCGGSAIQIYINGVADTKGVITNNLSSCIFNCSSLSIAAYADGTCKYLGAVDEFDFFVAKELTSAEMRSLFDDGVMEEITGRSGFAQRFNGCDAFQEICYSTDFDFCGTFDIQVWARWQGTSTGYLYARRNLSGNGWALGVNRITCGDIVAEIDGNLIKTCGISYNDFNWHFIRVYRDSCNVVHLEVDNSEITTSIIASDLTLSSPALFIGKNHNCTGYFDGDINTLRIYKGVNLKAEEATRLYTCVTSSSLMKFGGTVTKINKEIDVKKVIGQSYGEILGITEVRAEEYNCRSPEFIIEDLIRDNTNLIPHIHDVCSGLILDVFNADGKLIDIIRDLTQLIGITFTTDSVRQFHLHASSFRNTCFVFTHGCNVRNFSCVDDDTEIVNDLTVIGESKKFNTTCTFSGDGCTLTFLLCNASVSTEVFISCVEQQPEVDYTTCVLNKSIIFVSAPACGACNIVVNYQYEIPLIIRGQKQSSIDTNGRHSKRLIMPWIRTRNDGISFINGYLNRFKEIRTSLKLELPTMKNSLNEGDVVRVINDIKSIDDSFVVKSLSWFYPQMKTEILVGEFKFDDLEYEKQIVEKLHDLEGAVTEIKDIINSEQIEEILALCDGVNVITGTICGTVFVETLCLVDGITITVVSPGIYNQSTYNGGDIYGTCTTSSGFTSSGFTSSGYTTGPVIIEFLLLENGDKILKEDGGNIKLESSD